MATVSTVGVIESESFQHQRTDAVRNAEGALAWGETCIQAQNVALIFGLAADAGEVEKNSVATSLGGSTDIRAETHVDIAVYLNFIANRVDVERVFDVDNKAFLP